MLQPLSRRNLAELAVETIKRYILQENLEEGDRLPGEEELAESLAVSRNIIREALTTLDAEGLVVRQTGRGTFVQEFDHQELAESLPPLIGPRGASAGALDEFRIALELGALELVVQRVTDEEIEELASILERYERKVAEGKSPAGEDISFHLALLRATKNEVFMEIAPLVTDGFRERVVARPAALGRFTPGENSVERHRDILRAIREHDVVAAQRAMRDHLHEESR